MVACRSQLSSTKNVRPPGGTGFAFIGEFCGRRLPATGEVTRLIPGGKKLIAGGVKSLRRVYFATPDSRGRNAANAWSTRAAAPRSDSWDAFALQLVFAARTPACSAVNPPGCV